MASGAGSEGGPNRGSAVAAAERRARQMAQQAARRSKGELVPVPSDAPPPPPKLVVPIVVGTRPEAIKLVPVVLELMRSEHYTPVIVSTGQHHRLVNYIFELVNVKPDVVLWSGSRHANLNARVASVMERFEDFCYERFDIPGDAPPSIDSIRAGRAPAAVLVHGDTSSAMAAALSSFHMRLPVMHVEAGLRTGIANSPFPEEMNRALISRLATLHFAPTATNLQNLVREHVSIDQIFVTGNTGIDALQWATGLDVRFANPKLQALHDGPGRIVVVTAHRRENWGAGLRGITEGIRRVAEERPDVSFVVPMHPNPAVRETIVAGLDGLDNVLLNDPLGYATFSKLLDRAYLVITDSGGVQEEAPSLDKPVLVLRESTERGEGVDAGTLRLVGTDPDLIYTETLRLLDDPVAYQEMADAVNPYGDGHAASRIVDALEHIVLGRDAPTQFSPGYNRTRILDVAGLDIPVVPERSAVVRPEAGPDTASAAG